VINKLFRHTPVAGRAQQVTLQPSAEPQIAIAREINAITASSAHIIPTYVPHKHHNTSTKYNGNKAAI